MPSSPLAQEDDLQRFAPGLRALAASGVVKRYKRGTLLIEEGEPGGSLYFVTRGLLRAYTARADGQEFTFGFYGAGETLGELSLDGGPRSASVMVEEAVVCFNVARPRLEQAIAEQPSLAFDLLALVIRRARALSSRASDLALNDVYGRLVMLLRAGSAPQPDGSQCMDYPVTQAQLAQQIGCSRTMVTKLLGDLVKGGYLQQQGRLWSIQRPLPAKW